VIDGTDNEGSGFKTDTLFQISSLNTPREVLYVSDEKGGKGEFLVKAR
jgi:hypothetical protein